jgi:hypothetical protein
VHTCAHRKRAESKTLPSADAGSAKEFRPPHLEKRLHRRLKKQEAAGLRGVKHTCLRPVLGEMGVRV